MNSETVTPAEAEWIYRVLFGRSIEADGVAEWLARSFGSFDGARRALMSSEEFRLQYRRAVGGGHHSVRGTAADARVRRAIDLLVTHVFRIQELPGITFRDVNDRALIESYAARAQPRIIVADGSDWAHTIARHLASNVSFETVVFTTSNNGTSQDGSTSLVNYPDSLTKVVRLETPLHDLFALLEAEGVTVDVLVTDREIDDPNGIALIYYQLSDDGAIIALGERDTIRSLARARLWDIIEAKDVSFVPRYKWPVAVAQSHRSVRVEQKNRHRLAVATIVKNEEKNIERLLGNCAQISSYVMLLDTGSSDNTVQIARKTLSRAGLAHEIAQSPFIDFASARNMALSRVPFKYEWILMLDADEYISPEDYGLLAGLLDGTVDAYMLPRYNYGDLAMKEEPFRYPDRQGRLIRNKADKLIRYRGAVHEVLENVETWGMPPANLAALGRPVGGPHIHHFGYADITPERFSEKDAFYRRLQGG